MVVIALYVDDTVIASNCNDLLKSAKTMLSEKFDMTDLGEVESILGMSIKRDRKTGILTISQSAYLQSVLRGGNDIFKVAIKYIYIYNKEVISSGEKHFSSGNLT